MADNKNTNGNSNKPATQKATPAPRVAESNQDVKVGLLSKFSAPRIIVTGPGGPLNIGSAGTVDMQAGRSTKDGPAKSKEIPGATQKQVQEMIQSAPRRCWVTGATEDELKGKGAVYIYPATTPDKNASEDEG